MCLAAEILDKPIPDEWPREVLILCIHNAEGHLVAHLLGLRDRDPHTEKDRPLGKVFKPCW